MPKFSELSAGEGASTCVQFAANDNIKDSLLISSHVEAPPRLFFAEGLHFLYKQSRFFHFSEVDAIPR